MAGNSTNVFYGNKVIHKNIDGYFCSVEFDPKATGEHITELRRSHHFSREEFVYRLFEAGLLRVSVTTMGKWERGEVKNLELGQVEALCRFFGCSHDELVVYRDREIDTELDQPVFYPAFIGFPEDGNLQKCRFPSFFAKKPLSRQNVNRQLLERGFSICYPIVTNQRRGSPPPKRSKSSTVSYFFEQTFRPIITAYQGGSP